MSDRIAQQLAAHALLIELSQSLPPGAQPLLKNDKDEKPSTAEKFLKWAKFSPEQIGNLKDLAGLAAGFASGIGTAIAAFKTAQAALEMLGIFEKQKDPTQLMLEDIARKIDQLYKYLEIGEKSQQHKNVGAWRSDLDKLRTAVLDASRSRSDANMNNLRTRYGAMTTSLHEMLGRGYYEIPFKRSAYEYQPSGWLGPYATNWQTRHWLDLADGKYLQRRAGTAAFAKDDVTYGYSPDLTRTIFDPGYYIDVLVEGLRLWIGALSVTEPLFRSTAHLRNDIRAMRDRLGEFLDEWRDNMLLTIFTHSLRKVPMVPVELGMPPDPGVTDGLMDPGHGLPVGAVDPVSGVSVVEMEFSEGFQFLSTATSTPFGSVVATQTPYVANHTQALLSASTRLEAAYKRVWQESGIQALKDLHAQLYQMLYSSRSEVVEISPPLFTSADLQKLPGTEQLSLGTLGHFVGKTGLKYPATRVSQQVQKTVRIALAHRMDESGIQLGYALRLYCGAGPIDVELINYSVQSSPSQPLPVFPTAPFSKPFTVPARVYNAVQLETAGYSAADEEQYDLTGEVPGKPRLFVEPRQGQANFIIEVKFEYDPTDPTLPIAGHAVVTVRNVDPAAFRDAYILNLQVLETHVPGFAAPGETETRPAGDVDLHMMPTLLLTGPEYFQDRQDAIAAMGKMMRDVNERYVRVQAPGSRPRSPIERYAQRQQAVIDAVTAIERDDPREFERLAARIAPRLVRQG